MPTSLFLTVQPDHLSSETATSSPTSALLFWFYQLCFLLQSSQVSPTDLSYSSLINSTYFKAQNLPNEHEESQEPKSVAFFWKEHWYEKVPEYSDPQAMFPSEISHSCCQKTCSMLYGNPILLYRETPRVKQLWNLRLPQQVWAGHIWTPAAGWASLVFIQEVLLVFSGPIFSKLKVNTCLDTLWTSQRLGNHWCAQATRPLLTPL